jgi:hypothetical protein
MIAHYLVIFFYLLMHISESKKRYMENRTSKPWNICFSQTFIFLLSSDRDNQTIRISKNKLDWFVQK